MAAFFIALLALQVAALAANDCPDNSQECSDATYFTTSLLQRDVSVHKLPHKQDIAEYLWPSGIGKHDAYTSSAFAAPVASNSTLAWSWHDPNARYSVVPGGATIDEQSNVYLHALDGIRKFTSAGELLWQYTPERGEHEEMPDMSSLYDGAVYTSTTHGRVIAISMETGEELWTTKLPSCDGTNGWVMASEGVVILGSDAQSKNRGMPTPGRTADQVVTGLNATDGQVLWNFKPDAPVWNFLGSFAGDGTFTFQDYEGRAYRNRVNDGSLIWKRGGNLGSWTDGSSLLGPNKVVYTVSNRDMGGGRDAPGDVSAYRLEDGELLWRVEVPRPPNNLPAIGRLANQEGLSLIQPIGQQCQQGNPTDVYALDAETGELQWIFNGPTQALPLQAGDANDEARQQREAANVRGITLPNPWSAPTVDSNGAVYIGSEEGQFFTLVDADGDGKVEGEDEVTVFETGACFSGSAAAAIGPDMVVATNIDSMYVFKS